MALPLYLECFAVCLPGLEDVVARELAELGLTTERRERGGCVLRVQERELPRALLGSGCTSHWLVRLTTLHARSFAELERRLAKLDITDWIRPGAPWRIEVTSKRSRLYHTAAIAERVRRAFESKIGAAIGESDDSLALPAPAPAKRSVSARATSRTDRPLAPPLTLQVRFDRDECTLSLDAAGDGHHRRGHHLATTSAPLREDLARATLQVMEWSGGERLIDPMCGSGTIAIEAALLARRRAPGLSRAFAWEHSALFDASAFSLEAEHAAARERTPSGKAPMILASDREQSALDAALANARQAGVAGDIEFVRAELSAAPWPDDPQAVCVTNPPWGIRLSGFDLRDRIYAPLAARLAAHPAQRLAIITPDERVRSCLGQPLEPLLSVPHGGVDVRVWGMRRHRPR